ncbi:hypothetical protein EDD85DRAFT_1027033 [Armillaria nabsnona]|nr:hypothetical protein EDD85DRAFT_1027033 [Armillaria nabsnona]
MKAICFDYRLIPSHGAEMHSAYATVREFSRFSSSLARKMFFRGVPYAGNNDELRPMVTGEHEFNRLLGTWSLGSDFKGGMADDIPEGALDVWVQVASRSLQLNSVSMASTFRIELSALSARLPSAPRGAFGIITAFIAYYVDLSELLASEAKAVTVLPIRAF